MDIRIYSIYMNSQAGNMTVYIDYNETQKGQSCKTLSRNLKYLHLLMENSAGGLGSRRKHCWGYLLVFEGSSFFWSTNGSVSALYWRGEKQNTKTGITIAATSIQQLESDLNQPLNLLEQHAISNTHEKTSNIQYMPKLKQSHLKSSIMTSTSITPFSTTLNRKT